MHFFRKELAAQARMLSASADGDKSGDVRINHLSLVCSFETMNGDSACGSTCDTDYEHVVHDDYRDDV